MKSIPHNKKGQEISEAFGRQGREAFPCQLKQTVPCYGYYGELAVSARLASQIDGTLSGTRDRRLANGQEFPCPALDVLLDWKGEQRSVEVLILDGDPLLGTEMLQSHLLQAEMEEGGNVSVELL